VDFTRLVSPNENMQALNDAEVSVSSDEWHPMMPCQGGNPEIVGRNGSAGGLQLMADFGVALGGLANDSKKIEIGKIRLEPGLVGSTQPRLLNSVQVFAEDDYGEGQFGFIRNDSQEFLVAVGKCRKGICIED